MLIFSFIAFLQSAVLPGLVFLALFKYKRSTWLETGPLIFSVSQFINYIFVTVLTILHLYKIISVLLIIILEALYITLKIKDGYYKIDCFSSLSTSLNNFRNHCSALQPISKALLLASCFLIIFTISFIPYSSIAVHTFIDANNHWTWWAKDWAKNILPHNTNHYPQLYPANLSLFNLFESNSGIWIFTKAFTSLYFIGILFIFLAFYQRFKKSFYLLGLIFYAVILLTLYSVVYVYDLNGDIPVAFFAFMAFYQLKKIESGDNDLTNISLLFIFLVATANTKLAGVYPALVLFLFFIYFMRKDWHITYSKIFWRLVSIAIILGIIGLINFLLLPSDMLKGLDQSVWLSKDYSARFLKANSIFVYGMGLPVFIPLVIGLVPALFSKRYIFITMTLGIVPYFLWAFFYSNDCRNLSFAIPFLSLLSAEGWALLFKKLNLKAAPISILKPVSIKNIIIFNIFLVFVIYITYLDWSFNFLHNLAFTFSLFIFNNVKITYSTEFSYYKFVELFLLAIRLTAILICMISLLYFIKVKYWHLLLFFVCGLLAVNFYYGKEQLIALQVKDIEAAKARNIYNLMYTYAYSVNEPTLINTNSIEFTKLVQPDYVSTRFDSSAILLDTAKDFSSGLNFILLKNSLLSNTDSLRIKNGLSKNKYKLKFDGVDYLLLGVME